MKNICVFCGSRSGSNPIFMNVAASLGKSIAENNLSLVYGGGNVGLMGVLADAVLEGGGEVFGVIPKSLKELEVAHDGLTELTVVNSMHERKKKMYDISDAFLTLPGGFGTLDEFCEIITWSQLGYHSKPISFLNIGGYFDALLLHFQRSAKEGFITQDVLDSIVVYSNTEEFINDHLTQKEML